MGLNLSFLNLVFNPFPDNNLNLISPSIDISFGFWISAIVMFESCNLNKEPIDWATEPSQPPTSSNEFILI